MSGMHFTITVKMQSLLPKRIAQTGTRRLNIVTDPALSCVSNWNMGEIVKQRLTIQFFSNLIGAMKLIMTADLSKIKKKQYLAKIVHDVDLQEIIRSTDLRKETVKRRILLNAMKWNMCGIVYYLLKWKS